MLKFGTDGVRGEFGKDLTESYALELAQVASRVLRCKRVVIGRDTRESGALLEAAMAKGLNAVGVEVVLVGVAPTPAVAFLARSHGSVAIAITASHNLYQDNGIKIFGDGGRKLTDQEQQQIEHGMSALEIESKSGVLTGTSYRPELLDEYCAALVRLVPERALQNLHVALDCANGAFSSVAPEVFSRLGATVTTINATPNGRNINFECGATHPESLRTVVKSVGAQLGIAFDGDGDRLIAVDEKGDIVDGDHLLAISAQNMKRRGTLRGNKVVVTVMTNLGFHHAMNRAEIEVLTTPVGDRAVLEALEENSLSLGGEQSGHIIYRDLATTGDGLLGALKLGELLGESKKSLSEIARESMTSLPQVLINLRLKQRVSGVDRMFENEIATAEKTLGESGRVLVRASGTEPVVRVMVEAPTNEIANSVATSLAEAITARLG